MASLTPPRAGIPIGRLKIDGVEHDVTIHPEWLRYLANGLFERAGGSTGAGTTDLLEAAFDDAGIEEVKAGLYRLDGDINQAPPSVMAVPSDDLESVVAELREQVAGLRAELDGLRQATLV